MTMLALRKQIIENCYDFLCFFFFSKCIIFMKKDKAEDLVLSLAQWHLGNYLQLFIFVKLPRFFTLSHSNLWSSQDKSYYHIIIFNFWKEAHKVKLLQSVREQTRIGSCLVSECLSTILEMIANRQCFSKQANTACWNRKPKLLSALMIIVHFFRTVLMTYKVTRYLWNLKAHSRCQACLTPAWAGRGPEQPCSRRRRGCQTVGGFLAPPGASMSLLSSVLFLHRSGEWPWAGLQDFFRPVGEQTWQEWISSARGGSVCPPGGRHPAPRPLALHPVSKVATVKCELIKNFSPEEAIHHNKISITGTGSAVIPCAISILLQGVSDELAFVGVDEGQLKGETMDLQHGSPFPKMPNIISSKDYRVTANSNLVIITTGVCPQKGETRLQVVQQNVHL